MLHKRKVISLQEAQEYLANLTPFMSSKIERPLTDCLGEILAEDIKAPVPFPFFPRSGYDGFGVNNETDQGYPKQVTVVGELGAGDTFVGSLKKNQAVRIMTGAQVPEGVTKVVRLEKTRPVADSVIEILETEAKSNITPSGDEFQKGDKLLSAGTKLTAGHLSLLAAFGMDTVLVKQKIRVGILTTGSELLEVGQPLEVGKVYNSNRILLEGLVKEAGAQVVISESAVDDKQFLQKKLNELAKVCDLILTCGGVSVGDYDFIAEIAVDSQLLFNKLAMRPGSPTSAFVFEKTPVIALSGNPSACFVGFHFLADPLIQRAREQKSRLVQKRLPFLGTINQVNEYDRYLRGEIVDGQVKPLAKNQSSSIGALAYATCLLRIPAQTKCSMGMEVDVWLLPCKL